MRFIYKYRFAVISAAVCLLVAAVIHSVRLPGDRPEQHQAPFTLPREDTDWIQNHPTVMVGVDLDFAPIEQLDHTGRYVGVTADFLALVTKKTGLEFNIDTNSTWAQSLSRIKQGDIHILGAAVPSPQRREFLDFSLPYAWLSGVIIVKKSVTTPMTPERLTGMKVAVVNNYIWRDILEKSHPYLDLSPSRDIETALKRVSFGMADAMVAYMATASHHIERLGISNLKISGDTLSVVEICFAVNKSCPQLTRILNHVLTVTPEPRKKEILRKWISLEFSRANSFKRLTRVLFPAVSLVILGLVGIIIWNQSLQRQVTQRTDKLNRELIQRTLMEKALRINEEKYRSIFENIQDVYFEIRPLGKVLQISPSVEKVFGYNRADLINHAISRMFAFDDEFRIMRTRAVREERLNDHETLLVCRDGRQVNCSMNTTLVRDEEGNPAKIIGSIRDITARVKAQRALRASHNVLEQRVLERTAELRDTNKALNRAKEKADAATRAKSNFLANMSHEIRTPLGGIISASELVMDEALPPGAAKYVNIIRTCSNALLEVIDDILDFSKIEAGKLDLELYPFKLTKLISRTTDLFLQRFMEKQIRFSRKLSPDIPSVLKGDAFRIQQIITNLLSNAVKFTDQGGRILLDVTRQPDTQDKDLARIRFMVEDTGIGIRPENQEILFSPFSQVDASTTRKYGGSGLGLSICRQLVEAMHGTIRLESSPGRGSRFFFTLPLAILPESAVRAPLVNPALPPGGFRALLQGKHILVAEDTPTNQEIILAVLDLAGVKAVLADTGEKAFGLAASEQFDAVLMDLQMPVMDGFETARAIRKLAGGRELPIIAMTAHALKEDAQRCLASGMDDYISKPINQEKLFTTLVRHIYPSEPDTPAGPDDPPGEPNRISQTDKGPGPADRLPGIDAEQAIDALGVTPRVFQHILATFYKDIPVMITRLKEAWEHGEQQTVTAMVHSLKGSAGGIGAHKLHSLALALEIMCLESPALPDMAAAGLPALEQALNEVIGTIRTAVPNLDEPWPGPAAAQGDPDKKTARLILDELEHALEFPELTELDALSAKLDGLDSRPEIILLKEQIRSHDHDLARQTVQELQTIYGGRP